MAYDLLKKSLIKYGFKIKDLENSVVPSILDILNIDMKNNKNENNEMSFN